MAFTSNDLLPWTFMVRRSGGSRHNGVYKIEILPGIAVIRALYLPTR